MVAGVIPDSFLELLKRKFSSALLRSSLVFFGCYWGVRMQPQAKRRIKRIGKIKILSMIFQITSSYPEKTLSYN